MINLIMTTLFDVIYKSTLPLPRKCWKMLMEFQWIIAALNWPNQLINGLINLKNLKANARMAFFMCSLQSGLRVCNNHFSIQVPAWLMNRLCKTDTLNQELFFIIPNTFYEMAF